jgi:hypothetical protein
MYALFERNKQIGNPFPTEKEVWEAALVTGLVTDVPVADEEGGQILPAGYHVERVEDAYDARSEWKLPREVS